MVNLLNAGFTRLKKSKLFWSLCGFGIIASIIMCAIQYSNMTNYNEVIKLEEIIFNFSMAIGIIVATFTSLFLGTEYSDGGIRNKISIGNTRTNIYLSNLIISFSVGVIVYMVYTLITAVIGIQLFGVITISLLKFLLTMLDIVLAIFAYSSIITLIASNISNKAISIITSIIIVLALMLAAFICLEIVNAQEYVTTSQIIDYETMQMEMVEIPNPRYPGETKKQVCNFLININPSGQIFGIFVKSELNLALLPIYSLCTSALFSSIGLVLFKRKDIK